jgi:hypothetical protein
MELGSTSSALNSFPVAAFGSLPLEDAFHGSVAQPFIPRAERDHNYPNKYPLQNDRYHVAFNKPVHMLRPVDGAHIDEVARYGFNRLGYEAKQRYAFAPAENYVPFNPAIGAGHGWGTGPKGNFPHEDLDESLGGGYVAVIKAAPGVYRR